MKVIELIEQIESERNLLPTGYSLILRCPMMEGYFTNDEGQCWQIRRVTSDDINIK